MTAALSVVVPTHNRGRYAVHAIRSLLAIEAEDLQVVVTDTSTEGGLEEHLKGTDLELLKDPRLVFERPIERLDMTGNHNAALSLATGEYVCLIGDDDAISKEALDAARWARDHGVDLIAPNVVANYVWPDFRSRFFGARHARRIYFARDMGKLAIHDSSSALSSALASAAQGTDGLPKIYHGIVRRSLLEDLKAKTGAYFHGSSPDVSGAVGLAALSPSFLVVDYPLTVPGASGGSNTGRSALNQHKGKLTAESQTQKFRDSGWSAGVPRFFSVETVWAHAAIETLKRLDPDYVARYNFARLIAICLTLHKEYAREIGDAAAEASALLGESRDTFERRVRAEILAYRKLRIASLVRRARVPTAAGGRNYVPDLRTVAEAPPELYLYLRRRGLSWAETVRPFEQLMQRMNRIE